MNKNHLISKEELKSALLRVKKNDTKYKNVVNAKPDAGNPIETINWLKNILQILKK
jgi:hypothetical protein